MVNTVLETAVIQIRQSCFLYSLPRLELFAYAACFSVGGSAVQNAFWLKELITKLTYTIFLRTFP